MEQIQMQNAANCRDNYVDVAKGICILLVVCIHTEVFGVIGMPLMFVAVPMFFFLSGFYDRSERPFRQWMGKSVRTLLLPGLIWLFIGLAYSALLSVVNRGSYTFTNTLYEPFAGNGPVWFLFALFYAKILLALLLRLRLPRWAEAAIAIGGGYLGVACQMPLCADEGLAALPLCYLGKLSYPFARKTIVGVSANVAGVAALAMFVAHKVSFTIVPTGNGLFYPYYLLALLAILLCFIPMLSLSYLLSGQKWLAAIGRRSLGIMLTHCMMCHTAAVLLKRLTVEGSALWTALFLVAYVCICAIAYFLTLAMERWAPLLIGKKLGKA